MEQELQRQLLKTIHHYYAIGSPHTEEWNPELRKIIADKVDGKSDAVIHWNAFVKDIRSSHPKFRIENLSFLQFPNLVLVVQDVAQVDNVSMYKNFVVCLSLLCPYYTCYYEYLHKVKAGDRLITLEGHAFQAAEKFSELKIVITAASIKKTIETNFPGYQFIDHYPLMMNKIAGGLPYGADKGSDKDEYSLYQFLFNSDQPNSVFQ